MKLITLLLIPFSGAIIAYFGERLYRGAARIIALATAVLLIGQVWCLYVVMPPQPNDYFAGITIPWIPSAGIAIRLELDGMGFLLVALTALLTLISIGASWNYIKEKTGAFYFCLLWIVAGIVGVFTAHDLFLFYFFWEMMLIPMYFLIGVWGHENRVYAAIKFFLFTFISGIFLLGSILALYWIHGQNTGHFTFDAGALLQTDLSLTQQTWILLGLFIGFAVKLPAFGVHTWLPDAHTEAPTAGSIILAGLLLKTGGYGLIRFALPLCPEAVQTYAWWGALIGVAGIFYGAILAFSQRDLKRLVAYSSISHMGFVLLALAAGTPLAGQGAVFQMVCHGVSTGALFAVVGMIDERFHTRSLSQLGGLWKTLPRLSGFLVFFAIASLGLPGLGNFIAELLTLLGTYQVWPQLAVAGAIGLFFAALYSLKFIGKSVYGLLKFENDPSTDLSLREWSLLVPLALLLIWFGLRPGPTLKVTEALWAGTVQAVPVDSIEIIELAPPVEASPHPDEVPTP